MPERKQRFEPGPRQLAYPIVTNVLKKQIPKRHSGDSFRRCTLAQVAHPLFIFRIRARPRQFHGPERDSNPFRLRLYQRAPYGVHGHPVRFGVEGGDQRGYPNVWLLPQDMQCPDAVFSAAPG